MFIKISLPSLELELGLKFWEKWHHNNCHPHEGNKNAHVCMDSLDPTTLPTHQPTTKLKSINYLLQGKCSHGEYLFQNFVTSYSCWLAIKILYVGLVPWVTLWFAKQNFKKYNWIYHPIDWAISAAKQFWNFPCLIVVAVLLVVLCKMLFYA